MTQNLPADHDVIAWRGPWTRLALVILGLIAAAGAVAIGAEHVHNVTVRSWATAAALALGVLLLPVVRRADREGDRGSSR